LKTNNLPYPYFLADRNWKHRNFLQSDRRPLC